MWMVFVTSVERQFVLVDKLAVQAFVAMGGPEGQQSESACKP
jgi:hypothetical protein